MQIQQLGFIRKEQKQELSLVAFDLVQRRSKDLDPLTTIDILPGDWSAAAMAPVLSDLMKSTLHQVSLSLINYTTFKVSLLTRLPSNMPSLGL